MALAGRGVEVGLDRLGNNPNIEKSPPSSLGTPFSKLNEVYPVVAPVVVEKSNG